MVETKSAYISKIDDDTIKVIIKPGARVKVEEYQSFKEVYVQLTSRLSDLKFLIIVQEGARLQTNFMKFFKKDFNVDYKKAEAYLIVSPTMSMFFGIGMKILQKRKNYPVVQFKNEEEALNWLKTIQ